MTPNELFAKELMTYDVGTDSHSSFYNNLPYVKDYDLCNWRPLRMNSGNIIKFYQYRLDKPVVLCTDPADSTFTSDAAAPAKKQDAAEEALSAMSEEEEEAADLEPEIPAYEEQPSDTE